MESEPSSEIFESILMAREKVSYFIESILMAREKVTLTRLYFSSVINNGMICMDKDNIIK